MDQSLHLIVVLLLGVFLRKTAVWAQDALSPLDSGPDYAGRNAECFFRSVTVSEEKKFTFLQKGVDDAQIFRRDKMEYLIIYDRSSSHEAYLTCHKYNGVLAYFEDLKLAKFIADALSETKLKCDTLWVAGKKDNNTGNWLWQREDKDVPLAAEIVKIVKPYEPIVQIQDQNCLGFGKLDHEQPQLRPLDCTSKRAIICQRPRGKGRTGNSTHSDWIKIGDRLYKIYADEVTYDTAETRCPELDPDSSLAVVVSFEDAQELGGHLLTGKPSLINAWIGAKWSGNTYRFGTESLDLHNHSDAETFYPIWRDNVIRKPGSCILLDRYLSNTTYFEEARCSRERAVLCYKKAQAKGA